MTGELTQVYERLATNYRILLENPLNCSAVGFLQLLATLLFVAVALRLTLHAGVLIWLRLRCPRLNPPTGSFFEVVYEKCRRRVGLRRRPRIYCLADNGSPAFVTGLWRAHLFLAPRLIRHLSAAELEALLTHELVHIKRRDHLRIWAWEMGAALVPALVIQFFALSFVFDGTASQAAVAAACGAYLVVRLLMWGKLAQFRERSCDDRTVAITQDPLALASSLLQTWKLTRNPEARLTPLAVSALAHRRSVVEQRISRLLDYRPPEFRLLMGRAMEWATVTAIVAGLLFVGSLYWSGRADAELAVACTLSGEQTLVLMHP